MKETRMYKGYNPVEVSDLCFAHYVQATAKEKAFSLKCTFSFGALANIALWLVQHNFIKCRYLLTGLQPNWYYTVGLGNATINCKHRQKILQKQYLSHCAILIAQNNNVVYFCILSRLYGWWILYFLLQKILFLPKINSL